MSDPEAKTTLNSPGALRSAEQRGGAARGANARTAISEASARFLRRRIADTLAPARVTPKLIAENIAFGAAVLGAGHVELVEQGGWWFVASSFNWLAASKAHQRERDLFEKMLPFPEQSATGHRAEIYVALFTSEAYCRVGEKTVWIRGERAARWSDGALPHTRVTPPWCVNVIGFRAGATGVREHDRTAPSVAEEFLSGRPGRAPCLRLRRGGGKH